MSKIITYIPERIGAFILVLVYMVCFSIQASAQKYTIADSAIAMQKIMLAFDTLYVNPARSLVFVAEGINISEQIKYINGIEKGNRVMGAAYAETGDIKNALKCYAEVVKTSRQYNHTDEEARALSHMGNIYLSIGALDKALDHHLQSLEIEKKLKHRALIANEYNDIAVILNEQGKFDKAIDYLLKAVVIDSQLNRPEHLAQELGHIGAICLEQKRYARSLEYFFRSLKIANDAATYNNIGYYYYCTKKADSALYYYKIALGMFTTDSDRLNIAKTLNNIGELETEKGNYANAEEYLKRALSIVTRLSSVEETANIEENLSKLYAKKNDFKNAYRHILLANFYKDSVQNVEKARKFEEINTRFEVKETEEKNRSLQKENDLQKLKIQRKNIFIYGTIAAFISLLVISLLLIRQNKLRAEQQKTELEQKQLRAQMNPHFIFNCLNSIQHFVVANDVKNANKYLSGFALLMRQTLENSKDGIITLRREIAYLENYLSLELLRFEDKFTVKITCADDISADTIEIPSMIIQPFIENAIRHGLCYLENRQGMLKIQFYKKDSYLYCEVDDNGIGMERSRMLKEHSQIAYESHGMELTRKRLALVSKGYSSEYSIDVIDKKSNAGEPEGTTIIIKFPLEK